MFPTETARPIMQYVRELEGKVLALRAELERPIAERRRFLAHSFVWGVAAGALTMYLVLLLLRYIQ